MIRDLQDMRQTINQKLKKREGDVELFEGMKLDEEDSMDDKKEDDRADFIRKKR